MAVLGRCWTFSAFFDYNNLKCRRLVRRLQGVVRIETRPLYSSATVGRAALKARSSAFRLFMVIHRADKTEPSQASTDSFVLHIQSLRDYILGNNPSPRHGDSIHMLLVWEEPQFRYPLMCFVPRQARIDVNPACFPLGTSWPGPG